MKTRIDKDFFDKWKDEQVVMWCKKMEYVAEFCRLMHKQGLTWNDEVGYLNRQVWQTYKEETAYKFNLGEYCNKEYYENKGYVILDFEDYIINKVKEKMTKQELTELLAANFIDEYGILDLTELDFTKFGCDVDISHMTVEGTLYQNNQKVQSYLWQNDQEVQRGLYQNNQKVQTVLWQDEQEVGGSLFQNSQKVEGDLFQNKQEVEGNLIQDRQKMYKYEMGEIVEEGDKTSITGVVQGGKGDIEQHKKLFKDMERLNTAFVKETAKTLLQDKKVKKRETENLPTHYNIAGIDTMDFILGVCKHNNTNQSETFYLANTLKYLIRYKNKNGIEDLNKAKDYLNRLIEYTTIENLLFSNTEQQDVNKKISEWMCGIFHEYDLINEQEKTKYAFYNVDGQGD